MLRTLRYYEELSVTPKSLKLTEAPNSNDLKESKGTPRNSLELNTGAALGFQIDGAKFFSHQQRGENSSEPY